MLADHRNGLSSSSFSLILDSSVGLSAAFSLLAIWCLSIQISLACARASKLKTTNIVYSRNHNCWRSCNVETQCASCYDTYFWSRIYPTSEVKRNVFTYIISNALLRATLQLQWHFISHCQWFIQSFSEDSSIFNVWIKYDLGVAWHSYKRPMSPFDLTTRKVDWLLNYIGGLCASP